MLGLIYKHYAQNMVLLESCEWTYFSLFQDGMKNEEEVKSVKMKQKHRKKQRNSLFLTRETKTHSFSLSIVESILLSLFNISHFFLLLFLTSPSQHFCEFLLCYWFKFRSKCQSHLNIKPIMHSAHNDVTVMVNSVEWQLNVNILKSTFKVKVHFVTFGPL